MYLGQKTAVNLAGKRFLLAGFALVIAACTPASESRIFQDVSKNVVNRTKYKPRWVVSKKDEARVRAETLALLSKPLTESSAVQVALLNNKDIQASLAEIGIARADLVQAGLIRNPILDAAFTFPLSGGPLNFNLGLIFSVIDVFLVPVRRDIAKSALEKVKQSIAHDFINLATKVRIAVFRVKAARQAHAFFVRTHGANAASLEAVRALRKAGNITALDLSRERAFFALSRTNLQASRTRVLAARARLNLVIGLSGDLSRRWKVRGRLPNPSRVRISLKGIEDRVVKNSLALAIMRRNQLTLVKRGKLLGIRAIFPGVESGVEAERDEGHWEVGPKIEVAIPVFDFGQGRRAKLRWQMLQLANRRKALTIKLQTQARLVAIRLRSARRMVFAYQSEILPLRSKVLSHTLRQYNAMQVGVRNLLQAKREQIDASRRYIDLLLEYWTARAELVGLLAGGSLEALSTGSAESEPASSAPASGGH